MEDNPPSLLLYGEKMYPKKYNLPFYIQAVPATGKADTTEYSPINGVLETIMVNFTSATGTFEVAFFIEDTKILPDARTPLSLSGTTQTFTVNRPVNENDRIILYATNNDSSAVRVNAVATITEI